MTFFQIYLIHVCRNKSAAFGFFINFYPNGPFGAVLFVKIAFCPKRTIEPAGAAAVLSLVSLVSFVSFFALFAGGTVLAFGFYTGVICTDPPVSVFADKGRVSVFSVGAVQTVCSILTVDSVFSVYTILAVSAVSAIRTF